MVESLTVDGTTYILPDIIVDNALSCKHTVVIGNAPLEITRAVRLLLAMNEHLRTQIADLKAGEQDGEGK